MSLPNLKSEALQLFVFGPGRGELVAVRSPPGAWLVVDGCQASKTSYASRLLDHYGARPAIVVLTHPHQDHYLGLQEVIDAATSGPMDEWPVLGLATPPEPERREEAIDDLPTYLSQGGAEQVVSAILDRWQRHRSCRWTMREGDSKPLGEASVRVLSPTAGMRAAAQWAHEHGKAFDLNQVSTALAVEWKGHRIVLGSDLVEEPGKGWSSAMTTTDALDAHAALKVPHHGSPKALHRPLLVRPSSHPEPTWVIAPYASRDLPGLGPRAGVDLLLEHLPAVLLTSLPRKHARQGEAPLDFAIGELRPDGRHLALDPTTGGFPDCFVVIELEADGAARIHRGAGSARVRR